MLSDQIGRECAIETQGDTRIAKSDGLCNRFIIPRGAVRLYCETPGLMEGIGGVDWTQMV